MKLVTCEGGELLVNDVCITKGAVEPRDELDLLVERACNESPPSVPSVHELLEKRWELPKSHREVEQPHGWSTRSSGILTESEKIFSL